MRREEWVDREIRTMVQGVHRVLGVGNADDTPVSPLTISGDPPPDEETADLVPPLVDDAEADQTAPAPAPETGTRRTARRKHKHAKR